MDMKFSRYAAVITSASIFTSALAGPLKTHFGKAELGQRKVEAREDKSKNKYFHEPGYVVSDLPVDVVGGVWLASASSIFHTLSPLHDKLTSSQRF